MKLANFQALDPDYRGAGLASTSQGDRDIWDELHNKPTLLATLAAAITSASLTEFAEVPDIGDEEAYEGQILVRLHRARERNRKLVTRRKDQRRVECGGVLTCEACGFDFAAKYGERGEGFAECHHKVPLAQSGATNTQLVDLAVLCANCHRMIHVREPMLSVAELQALIRSF
jgi:5-methylcytosine-specific restriction protein A